MKTKNLSILWILVVVVGSLVGCSTQNFSPGPKDPIGPQGNLGPNEPLGPSSSDAVVIESNGNLVSEEYNFTGFEEIEINSLMTVEISQGEGYEIITEVEEDAVPYLRVSLEGKRLRIGLDPSKGYNTNNATLRAKITLPYFAALIVDGVSHVMLKDILCTHAVDIEVKGVSSLDGLIDGCDLSIEVSNLSKVTLDGSAQDVTVNAAGLSEVNLSSLEVQNLEYEVDETSELISKEN
jgi:hypothetical protein